MTELKINSNFTKHLFERIQQKTLKRSGENKDDTSNERRIQFNFKYEKHDEMVIHHDIINATNPKLYVQCFKHETLESDSAEQNDLPITEESSPPTESSSSSPVPDSSSSSSDNSLPLTDDNPDADSFPENKPIKVVVVGNSFCGKTMLIEKIFSLLDKPQPEVVWNAFYREYHTEFDYSPRKPLDVTIREIPGYVNEDDRKLAYPSFVDVVLLCFAVNDLDAYEGVQDSWFPEVTGNIFQKSECVIVGMKTDTRTDPATIESMAARGEEPISTDIGFDLKDETGCYTYVECSAVTGDGVLCVVECIINAATGVERI